MFEATGETAIAARRKGDPERRTRRRDCRDTTGKSAERVLSRGAALIKTQLPGNVQEAWVPKGKLLAGPIANLLKEDTSISPLGTITHITRKLSI